MRKSPDCIGHAGCLGKFRAIFNRLDKTFPSKIKWYRITDAGVLVVGTNDAPIRDQSG